MARLTEIFVALAAISSLATFFGVRAAIRRTVRRLGRKPNPEQAKEEMSVHHPVDNP